MSSARPWLNNYKVFLKNWSHTNQQNLFSDFVKQLEYRKTWIQQAISHRPPQLCSSFWSPVWSKFSLNCTQFFEIQSIIKISCSWLTWVPGGSKRSLVTYNTSDLWRKATKNSKQHWLAKLHGEPDIGIIKKKRLIKMETKTKQNFSYPCFQQQPQHSGVRWKERTWSSSNISMPYSVHPLCFQPSPTFRVFLLPGHQVSLGKAAHLPQLWTTATSVLSCKLLPYKSYPLILCNLNSPLKHLLHLIYPHVEPLA